MKELFLKVFSMDTLFSILFLLALTGFICLIGFFFERIYLKRWEKSLDELFGLSGDEIKCRQERQFRQSKRRQRICLILGIIFFLLIIIYSMALYFNQF